MKEENEMTEQIKKNEENNIVDPKLSQAADMINNPDFAKLIASALTDAEKKAKESQANEMHLDRKNDGTIKPTKANIQEILMFDPKLAGKLGYNESSQDMTVTDTIELPARTARGKKTIKIKPGELDDTGLNLISNYIANNPNYKLDVQTNKMASALVWVEYAQSYDPLKEWFDNLKWDGKDRISTVMQEWLGADDSEYNKFQIKLWLEGAVSKVYNKQQKFDWCLDLAGGQGAGKSTFLKKIAPLSMYVQGFKDFSDKDSYAQMKGCLIVNDDEMVASANSTFEEIKAFITMTQFQYRLPFGHLVSYFNKSFVLARTTNITQHLSDKTGQRRFLCIECGLHDHKSVPKELDQDYIDQLWAQAKHCYDEDMENGDPFDLTEEQEELLNRGRKKFLKTNDVEDIVLDLIDNEFSNANFVSNKQVQELMQHKLNKFSLNTKEKRSVRYVMGTSGWISGVVKRIKGSSETTRGYERANHIKVDVKKKTVDDWIDEEINNRIVTIDDNGMRTTEQGFTDPLHQPVHAIR